MSLKTEKAPLSLLSPSTATLLLSSSRGSAPYPIALVDARRLSPPAPSPARSPLCQCGASSLLTLPRRVPARRGASRSLGTPTSSDANRFGARFCDVLRRRSFKKRGKKTSFSSLLFSFLYIDVSQGVYSFAAHILRNFKRHFIAANRYTKHATRTARCTRLINSFLRSSPRVSLLPEFRGEPFRSVRVAGHVVSR